MSALNKKFACLLKLIINILRITFALTRFKQSEETNIDSIANSLDLAFNQGQDLFKPNSKI